MKDLFKKIQPYLPYFLALIGGGILPFAFAPFGYSFLGLLSPAIFLGCIQNAKLKKSFVLGLLYGIGFFGLGVNWVYVSIHDYGAASPLLAGILTSAFVAVLALFPAILALILNHFFSQNNAIRCLLAFPALWVAFEIIRGWLFSGFPWLYIGYSQIRNHLSAFAPLGSVWAVSWVAVFIAGILYALFDYFYNAKENKSYRNKLFFGLILAWGVAFGLTKIQWTQPTENKLQLALIQGSIPQEIRWEPSHVNHIVKVYQNLTLEALNKRPKVDLIIWPEGAIPMTAQSASGLLKELNTTMEKARTGLIMGIPWVTAHGQFYNSLIAFGWETSGFYHKRHLVPFGEYVPFEAALRGLIAFFDLPMSSFVPGPANPELISAFNYKIAPAICYEIAYPTLVQKMSQGADFILTLSNDTWFGKSIGPAQHLEIAMFRAIETQKCVIRATNTGFTAIIDPNGSIQALAEQFQATILYGEALQTQGETFWVRYGIWPLLACLAGALGLTFVLSRKKK